MSDDFQQFGFGQDDDNIGRTSGRLKMDKNETARVSFLWWPGLDSGIPDMKAETPVFIGAPRHYLKGVGYFINKGPEFTRLAGEPPKIRIVTIIVKWPMKSGGKVDVEGISSGNYEVMYWVLDEGKYDGLKAIHNEWPFGSHDLTIKCSDAQYQKLTFTPCTDNLLAKLFSKGSDSPLVTRLLAEGRKLIPNAGNEIGRVMTLDQVREKLVAAGGAPGGGGNGISGVDMVSSVEIDDALDNLLD